jgi:hypothetical protein
MTMTNLKTLRDRLCDEGYTPAEIADFDGAYDGLRRWARRLDSRHPRKTRDELLKLTIDTLLCDMQCDQMANQEGARRGRSD